MLFIDEKKGRKKVTTLSQAPTFVDDYATKTWGYEYC